MNPMKKFKIACVLLLGITMACKSQTGEVPNSDAQIRAALYAAPESMADEATVLGFDSNNEVVKLREGTNSLICVSDDPQRDGFNAVCYHKDVEPFMARGRQLRAEGKGRAEVIETRGAEIADGTLQAPPKGATLNIFYGPSDIHNPETGEVTGGNLRWVVYMPFETAETTGLPLKPPFPGAPWLMEPGTHRAHIMITPPVDENE